MFIAAQITIATLWNQPRCTFNRSIDKETGKYTDTIEYYSDIKKNKIMAFSGKWMELENVMLSQISQFPKTKG